MRLSALTPLFALLLALPVAGFGQLQLGNDRLNDAYFAGITSLAQERYSEAVDFFEQAVELEPKHHPSWFGLAKAHYEDGRADLALEPALHANELEQANAWYPYIVGDIYQALGQPEAGAKYMEARLQAFEQKVFYLIRLANLWVEAGDTKRALQLFDVIEERTGQVEEIAKQKQQLFVQMGEYKLAVIEAERLVELFPDRPEYYILLYQTHIYFDKERPAIQVMERLLQLYPTNETALFTLANYYIRQGNTQQADALLASAMAEPSVSLEAKINWLYEQLPAYGRPEVQQRVDAYLALLLQRYAESPSVQALRADVLALKGSESGALASYRASLKQEPINKPLWERLLSLELEQGRWAELATDAEEARIYYPNEPYFIYVQGRAHGYHGRWQEAASAFDRILLMGTADAAFEAEVAHRAAIAHGRTGDDELATEYYQKAISIAPSEAAFQAAYAEYLLFVQEDAQAALPFAQAAYREGADDDNPQLAAHYTALLAYAHLQAGATNEAQKLAQRLPAQPTAPLALEVQGALAQKQGNTTAATTAYQAALDKLPTHAYHALQRSRLQARLAALSR